MMFGLNRKLPPKPRPLVVPSFLYFGYRVYHAVTFSSHWTVILRYSVAITVLVFLPPDLFFSGSAHLERCSRSCFSFGYIFTLLFSIFISSVSRIKKKLIHMWVLAGSCVVLSFVVTLPPRRPYWDFFILKLGHLGDKQKYREENILV